LLTRTSFNPLVREFVPADVSPGGPVRLAVIDGEKTDPQEGTRLEDDLVVYTPWGELAYLLEGRRGVRYIGKWDRERQAPGRAVLRELLESGPTLILLDRLAVTWRRFGAAPERCSEMASFTSELAAAVAESRRVALVHTVATRNDPARDPYRFEHSRIAEILAGGRAHHFSGGIAPECRPELAAALRRYLFKRASSEPETYPVDPAAFDHLATTIAALDITHVFGGILGVLGRTVHKLWKQRPGDLPLIQLEHLDLRPQVERLAYDYWEINGRGECSEQLDWAAAKRAVRSMTNLADGVV
jgi:hypothetical protein